MQRVQAKNFGKNLDWIIRWVPAMSATLKIQERPIQTHVEVLKAPFEHVVALMAPFEKNVALAPFVVQ
jgi:hypothetical protein